MTQSEILQLLKHLYLEGIKVRIFTNSNEARKKHYYCEGIVDSITESHVFLRSGKFYSGTQFSHLGIKVSDITKVAKP